MPRTAEGRTDVIVTIADSHRAAIAAVAEQLGRAGLDDASTLAAAGVVTGSVLPGKLVALRAVPGVAAVEASGSVQLPDPGSDVQ